MTDTEKTIKHEIEMLPRSRATTIIYYIYNTFLCINAFATIVLTFIDDDWKESHNFDLATKLLQWSIGVLIFIWFLCFKIIPHLKSKALQRQVKVSPLKIKAKIDNIAKKKAKLEKMQRELIEKVKKTT